MKKLTDFESVFVTGDEVFIFMSAPPEMAMRCEQLPLYFHWSAYETAWGMPQRLTFGWYICILPPYLEEYIHFRCSIRKVPRGSGNTTVNSNSLSPLRTLTSNWPFPTHVGRTIPTVTILVVRAGSTHWDCKEKRLKTGLIVADRNILSIAPSLSFLQSSDCRSLGLISTWKLSSFVHRFFKVAQEYGGLQN